MLPQSLSSLADSTFIGPALRALLCAAYLWSGVSKLFDFSGTAAHFSRRFGLPFPRTATAATICIQLTGSAMVITGWMAWLGAISLALFTIAATVVAYPFWKMSGIDRARNIETFLEHVGLAAAFILLVWPLKSIP